jgi:predicted lipoprotein with Yx(FWY)xxD motif/uncharacterized cupredoxin-like copper-binding protein
MKVWIGALFALALATAAVAACGGGDTEGKQLTLGSLTVSDHGTKDVSGASSQELEVDDFYFEPSFLKGTPGETIQLTLTNDSNTLHNFTVAGQVNQDIPAKAKSKVQVTFPQSGALLFLCKYHTGQGMNGELLAGDATPQPVAASPGAETSATTVMVGNSSLGPILTDSQGLTLYTFKNDVPNSGKSAVNGNLASVWPPLVLASGSPTKPPSLGGDLTLITRDDGSKQVAYKGQPLYRYSRDSGPGDVNGQNVGGVWFVAMP